MYTEYFGLSERPFNVIPDPGYLYFSTQHQAALTYLEYGITEGLGFVLLTGDIGSGKTTLVQHLISRLDSGVELGVIFNTNLEADDLLQMILQEYGVEEEAKSKAKALDLLQNFLIDKFAAGKRTILIIDEAQNLSHRALEEVRMITNLHTDKAPLIQIILVGQPELRDRIRDPRLLQLAQRVTIHYHIGPLSLKETENYIRHRLQYAGAKDPDIFTVGAAMAIHEHCGGIPRSINIICDAALLSAFSEQSPKVTKKLAQEVIREKDEDVLLLTDQVADDGKAIAVESDKKGGNGVSDAFLYRLNNVEAQVAKLSAQFNWQLEELKSQSEMNRDKLVNELQGNLERERKLSHALTMKYSSIKAEFRELKKRMEQAGLDESQSGKN